MSLQVFLQAQLLGKHDFLAQPVSSLSEDASSIFLGRSIWLNLYCEVFPRALLAELALSRMLLGSSTSEQFLVVLAEEDIPRANRLLWDANAALAALSGNTLRLAWAVTENLGSWPVARKRLDDGMHAHVATALGHSPEGPGIFEPIAAAGADDRDTYFAQLAGGVISATRVGWSADRPAQLVWDGGSHSWPLVEQASSETGSIVFARRIAQDDAGQSLAIPDLAGRADGASHWGILLGDVDHFDAQLKLSGFR